MARESIIIVTPDEYEIFLSRKVAEYCPQFKLLLKIAETERKEFNTPLQINVDVKG
jgi:hypothetical protein